MSIFFVKVVLPLLMVAGLILLVLGANEGSWGWTVTGFFLAFFSYKLRSKVV
ncbi:hypothetical protein JHC11_12955 [Idiomarina abyssalis]|uniref:Uncharacterized protein n=1 Tax=Idiomarina abyssalis TaxID=86102 RepID=A0A8I1G6S1_9GAMM|nr:hypothetical protein [Idiomarina abyssalis]MBJ7316898.1 hypothetical protein [Idiomarina abyssalis]